MEIQCRNPIVFRDPVKTKYFTFFTMDLVVWQRSQKQATDQQRAIVRANGKEFKCRQQNCTALHCGEEKSLTPARGRGVSTERESGDPKDERRACRRERQDSLFKPARRLKVKRDDDDDDAAETR